MSVQTAEKITIIQTDTQCLCLCSIIPTMQAEPNVKSMDEASETGLSPDLWTAASCRCQEHANQQKDMRCQTLSSEGSLSLNLKNGGS